MAIEFIKKMLGRNKEKEIVYDEVNDVNEERIMTLNYGGAQRSKDLEKEVHQAVKEMKKILGIKKKIEMPKVYVWDNEEEGSASAQRMNAIIIGKKDLYDKKEKVDAIGEEISHYIRSTLQPEEENEKRTIEDLYVQEFFGFLGSRIYRRIKGEGKERMITPRKMAMMDLRENRKERRKIEELYEKEKKKDDRTFDKTFEYQGKLKKLKSDRESILLHQRPYEFARYFDLEEGKEKGDKKYENIGRLYSQGNKDIKKKHFRVTEKSALERAIITTLTILGAGIISMHIFNITGRTIGGIIKKPTTISTIIAVIIGAYIITKMVRTTKKK